MQKWRRASLINSKYPTKRTNYSNLGRRCLRNSRTFHSMKK